LNDSTSARRYARAIIETATDTLAVRDQLVAIAGALKANRALFDALANPGVPAANKKAMTTAVFQDLSLPLPRLLELDDEGTERVRQAIEKAVSGPVEMTVSTDTSLVGGLKVEVDGHLFDGTVKARLKALRQHLL
jgi:F0F1-type ATP synthase delta subunit